MEFKYGVGDDQPPPPPYRHRTTSSSSSSGYSYFTEQAIGAGYRSPGFGRAKEYIGSGFGRVNDHIGSGFGRVNDHIGLGLGRANDYFNSGFARANEYFPNNNDIPESIQRELEKESIREEIILADVTRRQMLEAEVRREMMVERELALRARGGGAFDRFSYQLEGGIGFQPREVPFQQGKGRSLEERIAMSMEERLGVRAGHEIGGFEIVPFQRGSVEPKIKEATAAPLNVHKDKDKIVILAKPEVHLSGAKRKVVSPEDRSASELLSINIAKKKAKVEWSCALCQVSATSERGLNDHIQGKKHKSKEAALRAQRNGQNIGIGVFPKKAVRPAVEVAYNLSSDQKLKLGGQLLQLNQTGESSQHDNSSAESTKEGNLSILEESDKTDNLKNKNLGVQKAPKKGQKKKKRFTFWCEMCRVGAYSENLMEAHRKGKKHMTRLQKARENGTSISTPQIVGIHGLNDSEKAAKQGDDENCENVGGVVSEQDEDYQAAARDTDGLDC